MSMRDGASVFTLKPPGCNGQRRRGVTSTTSKRDGCVPVGAALQILLGGQNQSLLLAGIHRSGRAIQHRTGAGLDLGKDEGVILI